MSKPLRTIRNLSGRGRALAAGGLLAAIVLCAGAFALLGGAAAAAATVSAAAGPRIFVASGDDIAAGP